MWTREQLSYIIKEDENFAVYLYVEGVEAPFQYQPTWPNNTPWRNFDDAKLYAEQCIESIINPEAPLPDNYPDQVEKEYRPKEPRKPAGAE